MHVVFINEETCEVLIFYNMPEETNCVHYYLVNIKILYPWFSEHTDPDTGQSVPTDLRAEGTDTTWSTCQERPRRKLQVDAGREGWTPQSVQNSGQNMNTSKC